MPTDHGTDTGERHEQRLLLWTARRTGVLAALTSTAGTPAALAVETTLDERTAERFVRALADYGFVRRVGDEYEVTNRALGFLATRDVRSIGTFPRALDVVDAAVEFAAAHDSRAGTSVHSDGGGGDGGDGEGGEDSDGEGDDADDQRLRHRLGAHASTPTATVRACVTAAIRAAPVRSVLDVYGGSGVYAAEFAARGYETTFVDRPDVVAAVGPLLRSRDVDAVERVATDDLPVGGVDLAFAADVLERHDSEANRRLVTAMRDAVVPGGVVAAAGPVRDSPSGRRTAVERLCLGSGDAYDAETVETWFDEAGLADVRCRAVPGTDRRLVVGRVPSSV